MYYNQVVGVTTTAMTKTSVVIDGLAVPPYVPYQAYGDFTGFGHYNKYNNMDTDATEGASTIQDTQREPTDGE